MDISRMRPVRISPFASARVMADHFSTVDEETGFKDLNVDSRDLTMSAGALCLYAATLLSQVHENRTEEIEFEASEREQALKEQIKLNPKYASFSEEQFATMAHNLILKDIRNSFAHGNFEIDYDVYSKRLNFVLKPVRKDFVVDKPIIISKEALMDINRKQLSRKAGPYARMSPEQLMGKVKSSYGQQLKDFLLMSDMLRLAENYLNTKLKHYERFKPSKGKYLFDYYPLLVSQITYEQNDYYNLFNRDSNVFKQIAYIRNSMVHGGYDVSIVFDQKTEPTISHQNRDDVETESLSKIIIMLRIIREKKWIIDFIRNERGTDKYTQSLVDELKKVFDNLFVYNGYEQDDWSEALQNK